MEDPSERRSVTGSECYEVFDMDGDSDNDLRAPGSDVPSPRGEPSVRSESTDGDDGGLIIEEVDGIPLPAPSVTTVESAGRVDVPRLRLQAPSSATPSPRVGFSPASVRATLSMHVASNVSQQAETQPLLTTTPTLGGRAPTRTGTATAPRMRLILARASIAMRRCKVEFAAERPVPCMFCSQRAVLGHAVLTFSHVMGEEDQQYCGLSIGLVCAACAPAKISKEDARAPAYKTFNHLFLLRRFSYFVSMLQQMRHCPVPRLDCTYSTAGVKCVNCEKSVPDQIASDANAVLVLQNNKTKEVAIFVVCMYTCRVKMERGVLPTMRSCAMASRQLTEMSDERLYYSPVDSYWTAMPIAESRVFFPRGLFSEDVAMPYAVHGICTNPMCFVCDCRQRNRTKHIGTARPRPGTMVRRQAPPPLGDKGKERMPADSSSSSNDNFRWLEAIIGLLKKENVLLDLLEENTDAKCRGCGKLTTLICKRCQAATLCSPECARNSRHALVCVDVGDFWTEIIRH